MPYSRSRPSDGSPSGMRLPALLDRRHLRAPTLVVPLQGLGTAIEWNRVEARLHELEQCPAGRVFQRELHERHELLRIVPVRVDSVGVPAIGEASLGLHRLDLE